MIGHAVPYKNLKVLVHKLRIFEELLQFRDWHLHYLVALVRIEAVMSKRRKLVALCERRVVVVVGAAVSRPQVSGDCDPVHVIPTDHHPRCGDSGHNVGLPAAVVVKPFADDLLLRVPDYVVEVGHHEIGRAHV